MKKTEEININATLEFEVKGEKYRLIGTNLTTNTCDIKRLSDGIIFENQEIKKVYKYFKK